MKRMVNEQDLQRYRAYLLEEEKAPATVEKYVRDLSQLMRSLGEEPLTKEAVRRFKGELLNRYSISSANSVLASVNGFLRYLGLQELCVKRFKVQKRVFCEESKELTLEEYKLLVRTARRQGNIRLALIIETVCATGIRISELSFITVEAVMRGEATVRCKGKTRPVFLVPKLCHKLISYCAKTGRRRGEVFLSQTGQELHRSAVWREMKRLCGAAGVPKEKVYPHNLRHLFARTFYSKEKDLVKLADILGHTSINTTRIYTVSSGSEHRACMLSLDLV